MFYYVNQHLAPSFPIELFEHESDVVVRSVKTGLKR